MAPLLEWLLWQPTQDLIGAFSGTAGHVDQDIHPAVASSCGHSMDLEPWNANRSAHSVGPSRSLSTSMLAIDGNWPGWISSKAQRAQDMAHDFTRTELWWQAKARARRFHKQHIVAEAFGLGGLLGGAAYLVKEQTSTRPQRVNKTRNAAAAFKARRAPMPNAVCEARACQDWPSGAGLGFGRSRRSRVDARLASRSGASQRSSAGSGCSEADDETEQDSELGEKWNEDDEGDDHD